MTQQTSWYTKLIDPKDIHEILIFHYEKKRRRRTKTGITCCVYLGILNGGREVEAGKVENPIHLMEWEPDDWDTFNRGHRWVLKGWCGQGEGQVSYKIK